MTPHIFHHTPIVSSRDGLFWRRGPSSPETLLAKSVTLLPTQCWSVSFGPNDRRHRDRVPHRPTVPVLWLRFLRKAQTRLLWLTRVLALNTF